MSIDYPAYNSEFEIQAELYAKLKSKGLNVRGEVKAKGCRFDLVIYDDSMNAIAIIECKRYKSESKRPKQNTKQMEKYRAFNVPVFMCCRVSDIDSVVASVSCAIK